MHADDLKLSPNQTVSALSLPKRVFPNKFLQETVVVSVFPGGRKRLQNVHELTY